MWLATPLLCATLARPSGALSRACALFLVGPPRLQSAARPTPALEPRSPAPAAACVCLWRCARSSAQSRIRLHAPLSFRPTAQRATRDGRSLIPPSRRLLLLGGLLLGDDSGVPLGELAALECRAHEVAELGDGLGVGQLLEGPHGPHGRSHELVVALDLLLDGILLERRRERAAQRLDHRIEHGRGDRRGGRMLSEVDEHAVAKQLDVAVVLESIDEVLQEGRELEPIGALGEERLHRLEGRLADLEAVVDGVLERAKVHLVDELGPFRGLSVQERQQRRQQLLDGRRLVVREAVEREHRAAAHLEVGILERRQEGQQRRLQRRRQRAHSELGHGAADACDHRRACRRRRRWEQRLELRHHRRGRDGGESAEALGDNVAHALLVALGKGKELGQQLRGEGREGVSSRAEHLLECMQHEVVVVGRVDLREQVRHERREVAGGDRAQRERRGRARVLVG
mmetsp:Transcript_29072/g.74801  ORF Transcript_29072/g.74801 Transcript_29072/m.74801 type:complete len:458 (-) Transcript_29072:2687-4060(-)